MGNGTLQNGRFNLKVSERYPFSAQRRDEWRRCFTAASNLLRRATNQQHRLSVTYYPNCTGQNVDIWLKDAEGWTDAGDYPGLGTGNIHMTLSPEDRFLPFQIVHEFGHYGYGALDEYLRRNETAGGACLRNRFPAPCIMEAEWTEGDRYDVGTSGNRVLVKGVADEFCGPANHDPTLDNWQNELRAGQSCWETMQHYRPDLTLPPPAVPILAMPAMAAPGEGVSPAAPPPPAQPETPVAGVEPDEGEIEWIEPVEEQRFLLALDRSDSMAGRRLEEAKHGARWWVDQVAIGDWHGSLSYADGVTIDYPLQRVEGDEDRQAHRVALDRLEAGGQAALGAALAAAVDEMCGGREQAVTQVLVLVSAGPPAGDHPPLEVLPKLRECGVMVFPVGIGEETDEELLQHLASQTGGEFYRIAPTLPVDEQEFRLRLAIQEIAGRARTNYGVVTTARGSVEQGLNPHEVWVEEGSERVTFVVSWKNAEDVLLLDAVSPGGEPIRAETKEAGQPYATIEVAQPEPGLWSLVVTPVAVAEAGEYALMTFGQNPLIAGGMATEKWFYRLGEPISLRLKTYYEGPITGVMVRGVVQRPDGEQEELGFVDDGDRGRGDLRANDALYSTRVHGTDQPGIYTFRVIVESDGDTAEFPKTHEGPEPAEEPEYGPIPRFRRQLRLSVCVSEEGEPAAPNM